MLQAIGRRNKKLKILLILHGVILQFTHWSYFQVYPFMLTERNSLRQSRDVGDATKSSFVPQSLVNSDRRNSAARAPTSPSKMSSCCRRTRSFSLDINDEGPLAIILISSWLMLRHDKLECFKSSLIFENEPESN